jgi:hypothetical protein
MYQAVDGQAIKGMHDRTRHHIKVAIVGAGSSAYGWRGAQSGIGTQCREVGPSQGTVTTMNTPQIVGENALARRVLREDAG